MRNDIFRTISGGHLNPMTCELKDRPHGLVVMHSPTRSSFVIEAASRLGRKDWILLFMGGIFSLTLADVITPDIAHHILMMTLHGLEHLFLGGRPNIRGTLSK